MTFETVLQVFHDYLEADSMYEIVTTSHGYALLEWGEKQEDWTNCWHLSTPEIMLNQLLNVYEMFLMWQILRNTDRDELTPEEQASINQKGEQLRQKCLST